VVGAQRSGSGCSSGSSSGGIEEMLSSSLVFCPCLTLSQRWPSCDSCCLARLSVLLMGLANNASMAASSSRTSVSVSCSKVGEAKAADRACLS